MVKNRMYQLGEARMAASHAGQALYDLWQSAKEIPELADETEEINRMRGRMLELGLIVQTMGVEESAQDS